MRISDWSSDVCSSDLCQTGKNEGLVFGVVTGVQPREIRDQCARPSSASDDAKLNDAKLKSSETANLKLFSFIRSRCRSEEHTSELQSLMRISYAVFCLKKQIYLLYSTPLTSSY